MRRSKMGGVLGSIMECDEKHTFDEWARIFECKTSDVNNALYGKQDLIDKHIVLKRHRVSDSVRETIDKLESLNEGKKTVDELMEITGYSKNRIHYLIAYYPKIRKFFLRIGDQKFTKILEKIDKHWEGVAKFPEEWEELTGVEKHELKSVKIKLEKHFGKPVFKNVSQYRIDLVNKLAGQLTLSEWAKQFNLELSATHHFLNRNGVHHLVKK